MESIFLFLAVMGLCLMTLGFFVLVFVPFFEASFDRGNTKPDSKLQLNNR